MFPDDEKPVEEYRQERNTDPFAFIGGMFGVIVIICVALALPVIAKGSESVKKIETKPLEYIEARLLKHGEIKEEKELPDRIVPALPTAPEEVIPLDREEEKPEPKEKPKPKEKKQADAVDDDKLRQVFDNARNFAEIQDDYVPEGHPDGVPDGQVTDPNLASLGDTYSHRISGLVKERWIVSTLLSDEQKEKLKVKINLRFDIDMTIVSVKFLEKSGNTLFDDSVQNAVDRLRKEVRNLPSPPEAVAPQVFGGGINIKLNGKEASYE